MTGWMWSDVSRAMQEFRVSGGWRVTGLPRQAWELLLHPWELEWTRLIPQDMQQNRGK